MFSLHCYCESILDITAERSSSYLLSLLLFSHMVMSDSLWPQGLQHARLPCPSPSLGICSNSCPSSWWCHPAITSSVVPFSSCLLSSVRVFSSESALHMRRPQYWSFSFSLSPSSKYSGLISFRIDWFDLFAVQGLQESSPTPQCKSSNCLALSLFNCPTLSSIHNYWKTHSFDYTDLYQQSHVSTFF